MNSPLTPKAVVFDIGKVLLDFDYGIAAQAMAAHCDLRPEQIRGALDHSPLLFEYETGLMSTAEFFARVQDAIGFRGDLALFRRMFADIFTPMPEMVELHRQLRERRVPTFILSNTNELAVGHIRERYAFFAGFDGYSLSYEQRSMKPDSRIYEAVEEMSGCRGAELLYLDDRPENVAAAAVRGWQAIQHLDPAVTLPVVARSGVLG
jgi:HAD superfamily hydrolase (TIGR01509 family)